MKVAAIQVVSGVQVGPNLHTVRQLIAEAAAAGAELVALPEYFCAMGRSDTDKLAYREVLGEGPIQQFLADCARSSGVWLVGGTLPLQARDDQHIRNTSLVYDPQGRRVAHYDKIHLFRFECGEQCFDEARVVEAGRQPVVFRMQSRAGGTLTVGLSVCYDLRFPELYRRLAQESVDLLLVPSAFTHTTGQAHWETLLRARAIENQAYVLAPAQGGIHENGRHTWGHSMLVDPWGSVQSVREHEGAGVVLGELDLGFLRQVRTQLPALEHRIL